MARRAILEYCSSLLLLAFLCSACSTTRLVDVWKDDTFTKGSIEKLLIVGVSDNERNRRLFESTFVKLFQDAGIEAVASYSLMPADETPEKDAVLKVTEGGDFDAVLVTYYVGTEQESVYVPATTRYEPVHVGGYRGYYRTAYVTVHEPGYYDEQTLVFLETNIYRLPEEKLIWSTRSETIDPTSTNKLLEALGDAIMKNLKANGAL